MKSGTKGRRIETGDGTVLVLFDENDGMSCELWACLDSSLPDGDPTINDVARAGESFIVASSVEHVDALIRALETARELLGARPRL